MKVLTGRISTLLIPFLLAGLLFSCARKPLAPVALSCAPMLSDDLDLDSLKKASRNSLAYLEEQDPGTVITVADKPLPISRLQESLEFFLSLLDTDPSAAELDRQIKENFDIYQATGRSGFNPRRKMLVTGYYQPVFAGSLTRQDNFIYPLYSIPDDLVRKTDEEGKTVYGRLDNGKLVPYWSRTEIETGNKAAGSELVWLKDLFDAFVLHVQGSGLIQLRDGSIRAVHYAGKNGRPYKSIGKHLVTTGRMKLEETNLDSIRAYLDSHPAERLEILHHNASYIFFDWTESHGAIGNLGRELTAGRSIAVDQSCFPPGALGYLVTSRPVLSGEKNAREVPMHRFVLVQDTGSAIRGPGRVDLFWGTGKQAGSEAGMMKEDGALYFLVLKENRST